MTRLHIEPRDARTSYLPGEVLSGTIAWALDAAVPFVELQLRWTTSGKGKEDSELVASMRIDAPPQEGAREFQFRLPDSPYSFQGKLVSLAWSLHLTAGQSHTSRDVSISPSGEMIDLYRSRS